MRTFIIYDEPTFSKTVEVEDHEGLHEAIRRAMKDKRVIARECTPQDYREYRGEELS